MEPSTIHTLCIYHGNNNVENIEQINALTTIFNNLLIPLLHTEIAPHIPPNIQVNKSKKGNALTCLITNLPQNNEIPPLPNYETNKPFKFLPQYCYYIDDSFLPSQQTDDSWTSEKARYGVYNQSKNIELAIRLLGLQKFVRVELLVTNETLKIINEEYSNKPAHIFTNCLNGLYVIKTQIKHSTLHNNHLDKIILQEIVELLNKGLNLLHYIKYKHMLTLKAMKKLTNLLKKVKKKNIPMP